MLVQRISITRCISISRDTNKWRLFKTNSVNGNKTYNAHEACLHKKLAKLFFPRWIFNSLFTNNKARQWDALCKIDEANRVFFGMCFREYRGTKLKGVIHGSLIF